MESAHFEGPGGVIYSPASQHSKELAKWEMRPLADGSVNQSMIDAARRAGDHHGAFEYQEYPKAMCKAEQTPNGIKLVDLSQSAHSDADERNLLSRGYRPTASEAMAYVEACNQEMAVAAANRAFLDRRMSTAAQVEADAVDSTVAKHLGEIPAQRVVKRVRRTKAQIAAAKES